MAVDVLQAFLTKRLFDVGGDDNRVASLREAATEVAALIKAAPQRTSTFTMIAIDGSIAPDEPIIAEVMKVLEKHWNSYAGAFTDSKLPTVTRAIVLHALSLAAGSEGIAAAVSLTARSLLPILGDAGDRDLWIGIVSDAERRLELRATREWSLPSAASVAQAEIEAAPSKLLESPKLGSEWLAKRLVAAAGPNDEDGEALERANPQWPNSPQPWAHAFGPIAARAIAGSVNAVVEKLVNDLNERDRGHELQTAIGDYVSATVTALVKTSIGLERRTGLMWWKESLYSPAAQVSYRTLSPSIAAALVAADAAAQTGPFAPRMTEAIVSETLRSIDPATMADGHLLADHGAAIATADTAVQEVLDRSYLTINNEPGRTPLGSLVPSSRRITAEALRARVGLAGDERISAIDLGVWLYRDLQAAAATPPPAARKRRGKAA